MLDVARQKLGKEHLENRVELICADAMTLPYPSESMDDAIFTSFTLELFDTPETPGCLSRMHTSLAAWWKVGGSQYVETRRERSDLPHF